VECVSGYWFEFRKWGCFTLYIKLVLHSIIHS